MKASVNELPQQVELTLVTEEKPSPELLKIVEETRYQLMARIATRVMLQENKISISGGKHVT